MNIHTFDHRKEKTLEGKFDKFFDNATHYFENVTDRKLYTYRNILEYVDGEYKITNPITENNLREMRLNMDAADAESFDKFVQKHWGNKKETVEVSAGVTETKKRGRRKKTEI